MQVFLDYCENTKVEWKKLFDEYDQQQENNKQKVQKMSMSEGNIL